MLKKIYRILSLYWFKFRQKFLAGKAIRNCHIDPSATVHGGTQMTNSSIGRHSYIGYNCSVNTAEIGNFCSIAGDVIIGASEHPMDWASTSPAFEGIKNSSPRKRFANFAVPAAGKVIIGSDVWIGEGAFLKSGVTIGHGAVVGSRAVVTKDVEPYAIVVGCPARIIRFRFSEELRHCLIESEWWNLSDIDLMSIGQLVKDPQTFAEKARDLANQTNGHHNRPFNHS